VWLHDAPKSAATSDRLQPLLLLLLLLLLPKQQQSGFCVFNRERKAMNVE
jgi:hypothetical protein